ncbi:hypothetical protein IQ241_15750 [Romeria aff. gracilis LEGE 07310]|uniref:Uncharacterized protein n=1 Tax=Vasconcelosia minhoensis LEGE 07310 TaxID=915328 RepID=A0A8J7AGI0_9CYAN|nr:hypothetical protein [Romeria gracilis]MBE9078731.1 hypothetical protein [Romeria aff. gracilis LEGE 07310]
MLNVLEQVQAVLEAPFFQLGLINSEEYNQNPVDWIRKHLEGLFGL